MALCSPGSRFHIATSDKNLANGIVLLKVPGIC